MQMRTFKPGDLVEILNLSTSQIDHKWSCDPSINGLENIVTVVKGIVGMKYYVEAVIKDWRFKDHERSFSVTSDGYMLEGWNHHGSHGSPIFHPSQLRLIKHDQGHSEFHYVFPEDVPVYPY